MAVSKVILNGTTLIDTTDKTVTAASMLNGVTALKNDGTTATGNIASKTSSDLSANGATVTAPAGYYSSAATKTVASGTAGTPTATKGTVSNHSISITPSVTNTSGYITGSTINGTAVSVTASELASGNKSITQNGTDIDVVGYSTVSVDVSGGGGATIEGIKINGGTFTVATSFSGTQTIPHGLGKKPMAGCIWPITNTTNNSGTYAGVGGWFSFATGDKSNIFPSTIEVQNPDSSIQDFAEVGLYVANGGNILEPSRENAWSFGSTYFQEPDATNLYFSIPSNSGVILGGVEYGWWAACADDNGNVSAGGSGNIGFTADEVAMPDGMTGAIVFSSAITTTPRYAAFRNATAITSVATEYDMRVSTQMFYGCTSMTRACFGNASIGSTSSDVFRGCSALSVLDWGSGAFNMGADSMRDCNNLSVLILRKTGSPAGMSTQNVFRNCTPIQSGGAGITIYIPTALYNNLGTGTNDYKANTNWAVFDAYGTITWAKLEGSIYESPTWWKS